MQRRNVAHFVYAMNIVHSGKLGKIHTLYAHPAGMGTSMSGWRPAEPEPAREDVDWDLYLGPAAWRPFNRGLLDGAKSRSGWAWVSESRSRLPRPRRGYPALIPRPEQEIFSTPPLFFLGAGARLDYCLFTKTGRKPSSW